MLGGTAAISEQADMRDYGKVWFDDNSIANILALGNMTEKYRVTMDSAIENAFHVHTPKKIIKFAKDKATNLYMYPHRKFCVG